jgi:hypothetical protein
MIIKSNTPLSDNELRRVRGVFQNRLLQTDIEFSLQYIFPGVRIKLDGDTLLIGNPPWDLSQEIEL